VLSCASQNAGSLRTLVFACLVRRINKCGAAPSLQKPTRSSVTACDPGHDSHMPAECSGLATALTAANPAALAASSNPNAIRAVCAIDPNSKEQ
jgi:dethiobiotin synthetase